MYPYPNHPSTASVRPDNTGAHKGDIVDAPEDSATSLTEQQEVR